MNFATARRSRSLSKPAECRKGRLDQEKTDFTGLGRGSTSRLPRRSRDLGTYLTLAHRISLPRSRPHFCVTRLFLHRIHLPAFSSLLYDKIICPASRASPRQQQTTLVHAALRQAAALVGNSRSLASMQLSRRRGTRRQSTRQIPLGYVAPRRWATGSFRKCSSCDQTSSPTR
jgi:hypothetical protein